MTVQAGDMLLYSEIQMRYAIDETTFTYPSGFTEIGKGSTASYPSYPYQAKFVDSYKIATGLEGGTTLAVLASTLGNISLIARILFVIRGNIPFNGVPIARFNGVYRYNTSATDNSTPFNENLDTTVARITLADYGSLTGNTGSSYCFLTGGSDAFYGITSRVAWRLKLLDAGETGSSSSQAIKAYDSDARFQAGGSIYFNTE